MRCSGCGKDIPFGGQVCPFCQRDKSSDQASTVAGMTAMIIGGFIGNLVGGCCQSNANCSPHDAVRSFERDRLACDHAPLSQRG